MHRYLDQNSSHLRRSTVVLTVALILAACGGSSQSARETGPRESSPSTSASQEYTWGEKLGAIDGAARTQWPTYERRLAQSAERCRESEERTADYVVFSRNYLDERGRTVSLLDIMADGILASIPPNASGSVNCREVLSIWITLNLQ